ncbi:SAM domain protein (macronuclear) [Tetrahymena thermophila SB210]|uniref:SAM domain protein n=1 Tax=Tetrahymena thermophila (strain SB210) TaxID=312017 RepID=Q24DL3_TETTS|nr:SAM domain protein [Tetrahymena thermophila SB210]EAS05835.2 SAM domain protein [Tetrahymena thermophila SB210]|eukprot:XP_001026080.2 SAM domain protein [Tetrahymena thermophila SB210]
MRRGVSNPKKSQSSNTLESEVKKNEDKLLQLKQAMNKEKTKREENMRTSGSRWKTSTTDQPIKNYANQVLDKKNLNLTQQSSNTSSSTSKPVIKPPTLKIGNYTKPETNQVQSKILKRPSNLPNSRPSSNQSSRSALNTSLNGKEKEKGKENENNLNSSFRKTLNQSFDNSVQQQASSSMTSFTQQTDTKEDKEEIQTDKNNSEYDFLVQNPNRKPRKVIETKLNELSQNTTQELQKEVHQFLSTVNLLQYQQAFEDNGFDDLETILEINTEIMNSMKIPAGHQIKIQKRIEVLKEEQKQFDELHLKKEMKDQQGESSKVKNIVLYPRVQRTDLEELEPPTEEQDQYDSNYRISSSTATTNSQNESKGGELLNGNFNEEESHKSFLEALMEFRGQGKKNVIENNLENERANLSTADRKKSVRFAENVVNNERDHPVKLLRRNKSTEDEDGTIRGFAKNSYQPPIDLEIVDKQDKEKAPTQKTPFFYSSGGDSWSNEGFPYQTDAQIETDPKTDPSYGRKPKRDIDKISCYNCYKLVPLGEEKTFNIKNFCSTNCLSVYKGSSYITCLCGKQELKEKATFAKASWFCSEVCALELKDKPQSKNLKIDKNSKIDEDDDNNYQDYDEGEIDLDFGDNNNGPKSQKVLTLQQLEEKYKNQKDRSPPKKQTKTKQK